MILKIHTHLTEYQVLNVDFLLTNLKFEVLYNVDLDDG